MKHLRIAAAGLLVLSAEVGLGADQPELKSQADKYSYSVGFQIGSDFKEHKIPIDPDLLAAGARAAQQEEAPALDRQEMRMQLTELQKRMNATQRQRLEAAGKKNLEAGKTFRDENAKKEGVVTLPSGLQYKVLDAGDGPSPKATDRVKVNYRGTLINGTEFDSSYGRGQPATFEVNRVVKGWTEALQLMKVGSKWELCLPPELGYGARGAPPTIEPNQTLIFQVELLAIEPPASAPR